MQQYLNLVRKVLSDGILKDDRTGTGTKSLFGEQIKFDLSKGLPVVTTKKIHLKSVIYELIWMLSGNTNINFLKENGVRIWDEWRRPYNDNRQLVEIQPIICQYEKYNGDFKSKGVNAKSGSTEDKLRNIWVKIMKRCYDRESHNFKFYGAKGITVHHRWHHCKNFIEDVQKIPHWWYKLKNWKGFELDKDYYLSNQYGPKTTVWLSKSENNLYTKQCNSCIIENAIGECRIFLSRNQAARHYGISNGSISRFFEQKYPKNLKGSNKRFEGWSFKDIIGRNLRYCLIPNCELGRVYGAQWRDFGGSGKDVRGVDQIDWVINEIKTNPDSRRLIVSAWNPKDLPEMALPPCHCLFQFYVLNGKLSCHLYQRSCDVFLGAPFNIASYSILTHMIAHQCDLDVGEFIYTLGDVHIYKNHFNQVNEQLSRTPRSLPRIKFLRKPSDIFDYKYNDIEIIDYNPHPAIKAKVSV